MQHLHTLILAAVLLMAPAHATVQTYRAMYRAAPLTSFSAPSSSSLETTTTPVPPSTSTEHPPAKPVAQKREGQYYSYPVDQQQQATQPQQVVPAGQVSSLVTAVPVVPQQPQQPQAQHQQHQQQQQLPQQQQQYPNYYYPAGQGGQVQPMSMQLYAATPYQNYDTEGQGATHAAGSTGVSNGGSSYLQNFPWVDVLVYAAALGLVGSGSAMWYYQVMAKEKSGRAMMEFLDQLKSEDTTRMARKVVEAIRKYSAMNNEDPQ